MTMHNGKPLPGNLRADNAKVRPPTPEFLERVAHPVPIENREYVRASDQRTTYHVEIRQAQQVYVIRCHGELVKAVVGEPSNNLSAADLYNKACEDIEQLTLGHSGKGLP